MSDRNRKQSTTSGISYRINIVLTMIRVKNQRSKNSRSVIPFLALLALCLSLQQLGAVQNIMILPERELYQDELYDGFDPKYGTISGKRHICPSALTLVKQNTSIIQSAYRNAEAFHNGGGNLKLIETYLNSHMDDTLKKLSLKFYPTGASKPISDQDSATDTIIGLQREKDVHKRGGYDQRSLPGHFLGEKGEEIHDFRMDVVEPPTDKRWDIGLGPIATSTCNSVDRIRSGQGRNYDDKFMCSYEAMNTTAEHIRKENSSSCSMISIGKNTHSASVCLGLCHLL